LISSGRQLINPGLMSNTRTYSALLTIAQLPIR
jgi:hypothetical protein